MTHVLFVDDEAQVLDSLQNLLRKHRREWHMVFCLGAEEALAILATAPFDVIVSDMRMPGMDGAALLQEVKEKYPRVARLILSGHADRDVVLRTLSVAHQFLSKPCDADLLRAVIKRTGNLQTLVHDETIQKVVGGLETLPSLPHSYLRIREATAESHVALHDIAHIVEEDSAMSAKVLQLVNSAFFGLSRPMTSIHQAVVYLGTDILQTLALTAHVFALASARAVTGFSLEATQRASVLTARVARRIVLDQTRGEEAFAAAVLHDIGAIVLAVGMPDRFAEILRDARVSKRRHHEVEREVLGVTHGEVGAYLLGVWGLPSPIVEAVAYHHAPQLVVDGNREILAAVHFADALVDHESGGNTAAGLQDGVDVSFLESLAHLDDLPAWRQIAREEVLATL